MPPPPPPRGYSRFQVTGMIEWEQKSNPKKAPKTPWTPPPPKKKKTKKQKKQKTKTKTKKQKKQKKKRKTSLVVLYSQNYAAGIRGHYHKSSDCLIPKRIPKSCHSKNSNNRFVSEQRVFCYLKDHVIFAFL